MEMGLGCTAWTQHPGAGGCEQEAASSGRCSWGGGRGREELSPAFPHAQPPLPPPPGSLLSFPRSPFPDASREPSQREDKARPGSSGQVCSGDVGADVGGLRRPWEDPSADSLPGVTLLASASSPVNPGTCRLYLPWGFTKPEMEEGAETPAPRSRAPPGPQAAPPANTGAVLPACPLHRAGARLGAPQHTHSAPEISRHL